MSPNQIDAVLNVTLDLIEMITQSFQQLFFKLCSDNEQAPIWKCLNIQLYRPKTKVMPFIGSKGKGIR